MNVDVRSLATKMSSAPSVMICGVGKSYEVARLAASLLRSVGIKAVGVHATDVRHGDLNYLDRGSVVVGISHSGITTETVAALMEGRRLGCHTVMITGDRGSWGQGIDTYLKYHLERDGSRHGTIPTESVRLQLQWINDIVCVLADRLSVQELHRAHTEGSLDDVYSSKEKDA